MINIDEINICNSFEKWTASAAKSGGGNGSRQVQGQGNTISNEQGEIQRFNAMKISKGPPEKENIPDGPNVYPLHSIPLNIYYHFDCFSSHLLFCTDYWKFYVGGGWL